MKSMAKVTKDMLISDILDVDADTIAPLLFEAGMGCLGCAMASGETLEQACEVHGVNADALMEKINAAIQ
jgi:hybrid cluster-associated redox disulfide protein